MVEACEEGVSIKAALVTLPTKIIANVLEAATEVIVRRSISGADAYPENRISWCCTF